MSEDGILRIGLTGKMRSGKSTIADYLYLHHEFHWPLSFGSELKRYAHEIFPDVPKDPKPRELYQFMNVMRDFDPDVWIKHLAKRVQFAEDSRKTTGIVVTDARQQNEIDWLRAHGFVIVRVVAPEQDRLKRIEESGESVTSTTLAHVTEQDLESLDVDYRIVNDGTLDELETKVDELVARLKEDGEWRKD